MLMCLNCLYKVCSIYKALVCTSIQPCESLSEKFYIQVALLKIYSVQVCDFQFSTGTWFQALCILYNFIIIEVKSCYTVVALWMLRLLLDGNCFSFVIELNDTETLRIIYIVTKYCSTFACLSIFYCCLQTLVQSMTCENVISKNHSNCIITDKLLANDKCLGKSVRAWLYCIRKMYTKLMSVP